MIRYILMFSVIFLCGLREAYCSRRFKGDNATKKKFVLWEKKFLPHRLLV